MFQLTDITITQFRNYLYRKFNFTDRVIAVCGANGTGKTNLLDAIYYLCFTKSYFSKPDGQSSAANTQGFRIEGHIKNAAEVNNLVCVLRENGKKEFQLNGELYKRFSLHIGKLSCVFIAPDDVQLITGGGELRRNFLDTIIAQLDPAYLRYLIDYKKLLEERNSLLKAAAQKSYLDEDLLNVIDSQMAKAGVQLFIARRSFLQKFLPTVRQQYAMIASVDDNINIQYNSQLNDNLSFNKLLLENRQRDIFLQRSGIGIHKDDIEITMMGMPFKNMASQGQRKSLLFALKLAEFTILKAAKGYAPLLLLDDIFEKLDNQRMERLLYKVCVEENAQVFITDTHKQRLEEKLSKILKSYELIEL